MQIVIDISRKHYEDFKLQLPILNKKSPSEVAKYAIATGTPLTEGYNDALSVLEDIKTDVEQYSLLTRERVIGIIDKHISEKEKKNEKM